MLVATHGIGVINKAKRPTMIPDKLQKVTQLMAPKLVHKKVAKNLLAKDKEVGKQEIGGRMLGGTHRIGPTRTTGGTHKTTGP